MTPKENYLKVLKGEIPEWLPIDTYTFLWSKVYYDREHRWSGNAGS